MLRIIYSSRAVSRFDARHLIDLLEQSRRHNSSVGITGMLLYAQRSFLQLIEGAPDPVDDVYGRIEQDPRHSSIRLLAHEPIDELTFPDWSMGFDHPNAAALIENVPGYRESDDYPFVAGDLIPNADVAMTVLQLLGQSGDS